MKNIKIYSRSRVNCLMCSSVNSSSDGDDLSCFGDKSCNECLDTRMLVREVAKENNIRVKIQNIENYDEILKDNVFVIPAISINGELFFEGKKPSKNDLAELLLA